VTDANAERVYLCIREPSMVLVARLPDLRDIIHWKLPSGGAHGLDIDHRRKRLYAACDDGALVEIDSDVGKIMNVWPIAGVPDVTFSIRRRALCMLPSAIRALSKPSICKRAPPTAP
jgi:hypothetical protein